MIKKALTLTIVIPVYNEESYLAACLDSIAAQSEPADAVILVDNNSTDKTLKIAKKYSFIKVIKESKQSVLFARNTGFNAVSADLIGRIDADTILHPSWVAMAKKIFADTQIAAASGPVHFYDMPFSPSNFLADHAFKSFITKLDKRDKFLFGTNMVLRKSAWDLVKNKCCQRKDMFEDLDLAIHLSEANQKIVYDKRLRAGMSSRRYDDKFKDFNHYMFQYANTYRLHSKKTIGPSTARFAYTLGYFALYPLRRSYDPVTRKRTFGKLLARRTQARKNPMH